MGAFLVVLFIVGRLIGADEVDAEEDAALMWLLSDVGDEANLTSG